MGKRGLESGVQQGTDLNGELRVGEDVYRIFVMVEVFTEPPGPTGCGRVHDGTVIPGQEHGLRAVDC